MALRDRDSVRNVDAALYSCGVYVPLGQLAAHYNNRKDRLWQHSRGLASRLEFICDNRRR